jgi:transcription initiation factor TFIIB
MNEFKLYKNNIINIKMELDTFIPVIHLVINEKKITKKNKKEMSKIDKTKLWKLFENDKQILKEQKLECIYEENIKENELCGLCNNNLIISDDGFPTCSNKSCGIIYKNILDYSPEWRFFGGDDAKNGSDPARCGNPINPLLFESSFGCKVLCGNNSSYEMKKIKKWTEWQAMPHKEKSLYDEFQFITAMAHNSGIPKIFIDEAMSIHKDILEQKMFRGLNRDGIKSASIYIACKLNDCPRTAQEIAEIFNLDKTSASKGCSIALTILNNIERNMSNEDKTVFELTTPSCFIERYCSKLNVNMELTVLAKFICKKIEDNQLILNHTPHSISSGVVFFVSENCNLNITKTQIKNFCFVSEVTINKVFRILEDMKEFLIPNCILQKYM